MTFGVRFVTERRNSKSSALDRPRVAHVARHVHYRRREVDVAGVAVEADGDAALDLHTFQLCQEVDVEVGPAEFAVGDPPQAQVFLKAHDVANRRVLDLPQFGGAHRAGLEALARVEQRLRTQEAADVVGAERWCSAERHRPFSFGGLPQAPVRRRRAASSIIRAPAR